MSEVASGEAPYGDTPYPFSDSWGPMSGDLHAEIAALLTEHGRAGGVDAAS